MATKSDVPTFEPTTTSVREFFERYDGVARGTMKRRSLEAYRVIACKHLLPALGSIKLHDLTPHVHLYTSTFTSVPSSPIALDHPAGAVDRRLMGQ